MPCRLTTRCALAVTGPDEDPDGAPRWGLKPDLPLAHVSAAHARLLLLLSGRWRTRANDARFRVPPRLSQRSLQQHSSLGLARLQLERAACGLHRLVQPAGLSVGCRHVVLKVDGAQLSARCHERLCCLVPRQGIACTS
eukprot:scaffold48029_cov69-Phaeocystis_antarctica.AAC.6